MYEWVQWFAEVGYLQLLRLTWWGFWIAVLFVAPWALWRRVRAYVGYIMVWVSYLTGFTLWVTGALFTYVFFGWVGLLVGLFLLGIGVIPLALVGFAIAGEWKWAGLLLLQVGLVFGIRFFGLWLVEKAAEPVSA